MNAQLLQNLLQQKVDEADRKKTKPSKPQAKAAARTVHVDNDPGFMATWTLAQLRQHGNENLDLTDNLSEIEAQIEAIKSGDMSQLEAILYSQVLTLNAMFADSLTCSAKVRAIAKGSASLALADDLAHLALRAQDGCRKTISTLAEMKNPKKAVFIKRQQNLMVAGQTDNPHQLSEAYGSEEMDTRTARFPTGDCLEVEAVGAIDGTKDTRRQTKKRSKLT